MLDAPRQFSKVELWVQAALHVPPYPQPPEGSPETIQVFHPGRNYYTLCLLVWFFSHLLVLAGLIAAHMIAAQMIDSGPFREMPEWARITWRIIEGLAVFAFAASAAFTFISQRLNYDLRWYIITDRSLRIRTGVLNIQELTMTFSNIQEIRVSAGPVQNLLKLADVEVQSAGGGSKDGSGHIARFQSVSNANAIRDLMVERLRQYRDSGLGEATAHLGAAPDQAIDAAHAVLAEVRALGRTWRIQQSR
jgi:membrane protein YdbS with pleckstrin-like domain